MPEIVDAPELKSGKPSHKPVNAVWIPPMESLDRELVMEQREGRPFEVVQTLPLSKETPNYSALVNKLSMKDSATLYNSLIVSRHNWINYVFDAYWSRKEQYGSTAASDRKRDKMSKLCDSKMEAGPHTFEIRLFILKDEEKERKRLEEMEKRRESKKKAQAAQVTLGGARTLDGLPSQTTSSERASSGELNSAVSVQDVSVKSAQDGQNTGTAVPSAPTVEANAKSEEQTKSEASTGTKEQAKSQTLPELEANTHLEPQPGPQRTEHQNNSPQITKGSESAKTKVVNAPNTSSTSSEIQKPIPPASRAANVSAAPMVVAKPSPVTPIPITRPKLPIPPPPRPAAQARSDIMSSPENHVMISNLNTIARTDPSLNALMKIVASGSATHDQILQFQKYIQKAKEMGDVNGYYKKWQEQQQQLQLQQRLQLQRHNEQLRQQQLAQARANAIPKEEKLTAFQERYLKDATIVFEFQENTAFRFYLPKDAIIELHEKPEIESDVAKKPEYSKPKDKTSEAAEPKDKAGVSETDTQMEGVETAATESAASTETTPAAESSASQRPFKTQKKAPFVPEIIVSFLAIHNQHEINEFDRLKREEEERIIREQEEEKRRKEEEEEERKRQEQAEAEQSQKESDEPDTSAASAVSTPKKKPHRKPKRWSVVRRSTRQQSHAQVEVKKEDETVKIEAKEKDQEKNVRPVPEYSCVTVRLTDIPLRFFPMIKNSVNPQKEVLEHMEEIRRNGRRAEELNVWFHLDGAKDELLAETLRYNLNRLDYTNGGGKLKGKAMLKRLTESTEVESGTPKKLKT